MSLGVQFIYCTTCKIQQTTDNDDKCSRIVDILFYDLRLLLPSVLISFLFFSFFMFPSWRNIHSCHKPLITKLCCGKFSARERARNEVKL